MRPAAAPPVPAQPRAMKGGFAVKRPLVALLLSLLLTSASLPGRAAERRIEPAYPVPDYVTWLLETASAEVGYREGDHGYSKYGEWAGDPYCQWCAEYLCWCVNQVDEQHGTHLLDSVFPLYSGSNTGRSWFIQQGRFIVRWGNLDGWGYQWLKGSDHFLTTGEYIPQPGDWVFFTWTSDMNTDHVAMVEYCTRDDQGRVTIHCLEGNTPVSVKRADYDLTYSRILGFGTVHDAADWTIRGGNSGFKVRQLQEKLIFLGYLPEGQADGVYGSACAEAVRRIQAEEGLKQNGIANISTQTAIDRRIRIIREGDPGIWEVVDNDPENDWDLADPFDLDALIAGSSRDDGEEAQDYLLTEPEDEDSLAPEAPETFEDELPDWLEVGSP